MELIVDEGRYGMALPYIHTARVRGALLIRRSSSIIPVYLMEQGYFSYVVAVPFFHFIPNKVLS